MRHPKTNIVAIEDRQWAHPKLYHCPDFTHWRGRLKGTNMSASFSTGDRVAFKGRSGTSYRGTIRYIGPLTGKGSGEFLGIELRAPHGTSDGRGM